MDNAQIQAFQQHELQPSNSVNILTSVASEAHIALMKKAQTDFMNKAKYNDVERKGRHYQVYGK